MIGTSQYIGIAILVLAVIWGFLFVNPKSPVKKHWWSASEKLMIMTLQTPGYKATVNSGYISVWIDLTSHSGIMVDRIVMKIGWERITSFDWKSHEVMAREHKFLDFERPNWLSAGEHEAKLIAYTPEGYSKSGKFILEVDSKL
jgi:hypothetical protein